MERRFQFSVDEYYHVFNRGVEKRKIFLTQKDYERFANLLYLCNNTETLHLSDYVGSTRERLFSLPRKETIVDIGAWCLMPNHFHLLTREKKERGLSKFMLKLMTSYSMYFNKKYERSGPLLTKPFKAVHVKKDSHLRYLFAYIHLNPLDLVDLKWEQKVKKGNKMRSFIEKYYYSSFAEYHGLARPESAILSKESFPSYFQTKQQLIDFVNDFIKYRATVKGATVKGSP